MQVLKRHMRVVLIAVLLAVILLVSLFIILNAPKPSPAPTPSPTQTPTASPVPTTTSTTPTGTASPIPTIPTPTSTPTFSLMPGEVTQYQGQSLTPVNGYIYEFLLHPDVAIEGTQYINQTTYRLNITGLVNKTLALSYDDVVNNFTAHQLVSSLLCVEGWSVNILWQGVQVSDLLQKAGANPNATTLIFSASDGYTTALPMDYIIRNNIILAYKINNVTLPASTGWPFTLVADNEYGYKWIMWVTEINVSNDSSYLGYWESRGYPNDATITGSSSNVTPVLVKEILVSVAGIAVAAAAVYITFLKTKNGKSKFWKRKKQG